MDDKNKKELGYSADIQYKEDYYSEHEYSERTGQLGISDYDNLIDDDFMDIIQGNINDLIYLVPNLPVKLQTAINQVLKPVIRDWKKIKDNDYPKRIPGGGDPIITPPPDWNPPIPPDPWEIPDPTPFEPDPFDPIPPVNYEPNIITPAIIDPSPIHRVEPVIEEPGIEISFIDDDDLFAPATKIKIINEELEETERMKLEYTKNLADVIHHYTSQLKDLVCGFYMYRLSAITSIKDDFDASFLINEITSNNCSTKNETRHLMDSALRNEVIGSNKLNFSLNTFTLEGTLYHLKNFSAIHEMRMRYANIEKAENNTMADSLSNKILNGNRDTYDKKYDLAYINLYKYLNGSLNILEDCMRTLETNMKSKEMLLRKDGLNK